MKTVGFIGAYDKTDLIIYVAKFLTTLGKKVLVIDNTTLQKARYIVPAINPAKSYITEFEGIDVSIGFENYEDIKKYLGISLEKELEYDIALVDVDSLDLFNKFNIKNCNKNYFVTSFDLYSLKKGLEILNGIPEPIKLTKILFSKDILKEDDDYLNFLSLGKKILWNENYRVYLPIDNGDQSVIIENQKVAKIGIRKLSAQYKESLYYIVEDIMANEINSRRNKKSIKDIRKGSVEIKWQ